MINFRNKHYSERFLIIYGSMFLLLSLMILSLMIIKAEPVPNEEIVIPISKFADIEYNPVTEKSQLNISTYDKNYLNDRNFSKQENKLFDVFKIEDSNYIRDFNFRYCRLKSNVGLYFTRYSDGEPAFKYQKNNKTVAYSFPDCNRVEANLLNNGIEYVNIYPDITYRFYIVGSTVIFDAEVNNSSITELILKIDTDDKIKLKDNKIKIGKIKIKEPLIENVTYDLLDIPSYELIKNGGNDYLKVNFESYEEHNYPIHVDPTITDYNMNEETWIYSLQPTTPRGSSTTIYCADRTGNGFREALIRYNLTELTNLSLTYDLITSADLYLYQTSTGYSDIERLGIFQLNDYTWTEAGATWSNYNMVANVEEPAIDYDIVTSDVGWDSFNVLTEVQEALNETRALDISLCHADSNGDYYHNQASNSYWRFSSSEAGSNTPYIVIGYNIPTWVISNTQYVNSTSITKYNIEITETGKLLMNDSTLRILDNVAGERTFYINGSFNMSLSTLTGNDDNGISIHIDDSATVNISQSTVRIIGDTYFPVMDFHAGSYLWYSDFYINGAIKISDYMKFHSLDVSQQDIITTNRGIIINHSVVGELITTDRFTITNNAWAYIGNFTDNSTVYVNSSGGELIKGHLETIRVMDSYNDTLLEGIRVQSQNRKYYPDTRTATTGHDSWHGIGRLRLFPIYNFSYFSALEIDYNYFNLTNSTDNYKDLFHILPATASSEFIDFYLNHTPIAQNITYVDNYGDYKFTGDGITYNRNIAKYSWYSDIDGNFYNGTSNPIYTWNLTEGVHNITLVIQDQQNDWSNNSIVQLTINKYAPVSKGFSWSNVYELYTGNAYYESYTWSIIRYVWGSIPFNGTYEWYNNTGNPASSKYIYEGSGVVIYSRVQNEQGLWSNWSMLTGQTISRYRPVNLGFQVSNVFENYAFNALYENYIYDIRYFEWKSNPYNGSEIFYNGTDNPTYTESLPEGLITVYYRLKEERGYLTNWSEAIVNISKYYPIAIIDNITIINEIYVLFYGNGTVYNATISLYHWISSIDGLIYNGTNSTINATGFSEGNHTIYLRIRDSKGKWSEMVNTTLEIVYTQEAVLWYQDKSQVTEMIVIIFAVALVSLVVLHLLKKF